MKIQCSLPRASKSSQFAKVPKASRRPNYGPPSLAYLRYFLCVKALSLQQATQRLLEKSMKGHKDQPLVVASGGPDAFEIVCNRAG